MIHENQFEGTKTELTAQPAAEALLIAPQGLGFGEGAISYEKRAKSDVPEAELEKVDLLLSSADILVPIDTDKHTGEALDDDGCGEGRGITNAQGEIVEVMQGNKTLKKSLNRAKVFGGGATMALSTLIATNRAEKPLQDLFADAMQEMDTAEIDYGAHSDEHAGDEKSGCGAIDNAPKILENVVTYRDDIYATILSMNDQIDAQVLDEVLDSFASFAQKQTESMYNGKTVLDGIKQEEKVVKKLVSDHSEMFIVLNEVAGYTVSQHTVRDATKEKVQVFAVDMWRIQEIANRLYDGEDEETKQRAVLGEIAYTLATAATLTAGDLPVYRISESRDTVYA